MNKQQWAIIGFAIGVLSMLMPMILLYTGTTMQKIDTEVHEAKQACEATLPCNVSCEVIITAVPKGDE